MTPADRLSSGSQWTVLFLLLVVAYSLLEWQLVTGAGRRIIRLLQTPRRLLEPLVGHHERCPHVSFAATAERAPRLNPHASLSQEPGCKLQRRLSARHRGPNKGRGLRLARVEAQALERRQDAIASPLVDQIALLL